MAGTVDASDYRQVRRMARQFSRDLDRELKASLKEAGQVGVTAVKRKLDMIPVTGGTGANRNRRGALNRTSLRKTMQRNTRVQVRAKDVRIVQGARGIPGENARGLPRRLNQDAPFKHPVFGHEDRQVMQRTWRHFDPVLRAHKAEMTRLVEQALKDAVERIGD